MPFLFYIYTSTTPETVRVCPISRFSTWGSASIFFSFCYYYRALSFGPSHFQLKRTIKETWIVIDEATETLNRLKD